jgi:nucleoid DNA-binding protein
MKSIRLQIIEKLMRNGMAQKTAVKSYNDLIQILRYTLRTNGYISLRGFGTFRVKTTKPRVITSRIINNGTPTMTKERPNIKFKASKSMKRFLNI